MLASTAKIKQISQLAKTLKKDQFRTTGMDNIVLRAFPSGNVIYQFRIQKDKKRLLFALGKAKDLTPTKAKELSFKIKELVKLNYPIDIIRLYLELYKDPVKLDNAVKSNVSDSRLIDMPTLSEVYSVWMDEWIEIQVKSNNLKRSYRQQFRDYILPKFGNYQINKIKSTEVLEYLLPFWQGLHPTVGHPTGKRMRGNLYRLFEWARTHKGLDINNPVPKAELFGNSNHISKPQEAILWRDAPKCWKWLDQHDKWNISLDLIKIMLLVGKRPDEIRLMRWNQINFEHAEFYTGIDDTKMKKEHWQPLSKQAIEVLKHIKSKNLNSEIVFPSPSKKLQHQPISDNAILEKLKAGQNVFGKTTRHGFKSTISTWMIDQGIEENLVDLVLAHTPAELDRAYKRTGRLEARRQPMQDWADYVTG